MPKNSLSLPRITDCAEIEFTSPVDDMFLCQNWILPEGKSKS